MRIRIPGRPLSRIAALALFAALMFPARADSEDDAPGAFDWGARLRIRQEYLANVYDFSEALEDDHNYIRFRPQIWASWTPNEHWKLYAMLTNEHRHWLKSNSGQEDKDFEIHELIVENLYVEAKRLGGTPFGFILGRQNLFYGEGFVCWDGGPLDGSRTAYFNALLLKAEFDTRRFEAHVISDPERDYLSIANDQEQPLIEWRETGAGLYYTDESLDGKKVEAYYFYKREKDSDGVLPESDIHTIGSRFSGSAAGRFSFAAELAGQFGTRGSRDRAAVGGHASLTYASTRLSPAAGIIYLSGEGDPSGTYGGWNPIYSRWPKWSDLFIYALREERGVAYWENIASCWAGAGCRASKRIALEGRLYLMWAPRARWETSDPPSPDPLRRLTDDYDYRGTMVSAKLIFNMNANLEGHAVWEALVPGEYYDGGDTAHFLRWELLLKY